MRMMLAAAVQDTVGLPPFLEQTHSASGWTSRTASPSAAPHAGTSAVSSARAPNPV